MSKSNLMKKIALLSFVFFLGSALIAGNVEKTFHFGKYKINNVGIYQTVTFDNTKLSGLPGEPSLSYQAISLMLPPGEVATGIEISGEDEILIPGTFDLFPQQYSLPISESADGVFIKNETIYNFNGKYPASPTGSLSTQYLNGYAFALSTFTPMTYNPAARKLSYYSNVKIRISTKSDPKSLNAMEGLSASENVLKRVRIFAQNPEMIAQYPEKDNRLTGYKYLVITPQQFANGFDSLLDYYAGNGIPGQVTTTEYIYSNIAGNDNQQKIRNYIKQEVAANNVEYVLLGGDVEHIPYRGLYCIAYSSSVYEDYNIPADLYYSALDGEWNDSTLAGGSDNKWGEPGEDDLLPDVSVARCPFSNATELQHMVHKTLYYQKYPVIGELNKPYLVGEYLYPTPPTYGSDYMELLVDIHNDNGYYTHGIPSADNVIARLYDTPMYDWTSSELIAGINQGHSFIHHLGHANETYMMKLDISDITNQKFSQVNGVIHNYTLLYTQGCLDGSFDYLDCIAEKAVTISNFLVASVCNSRYGWFNQGTTDGPSQHLQREFVSALYNDTLEYQIKEIGSAHMMSKIMTAPYVGLPGEFEPGAQRWVHYDCNVLGDPALLIWTDNPPPAGINEKNHSFSFSLFPNPANSNASISIQGEKGTKAQINVFNSLGQQVLDSYKIVIPDSGKQNLSLDLSSLPSGYYLCKVETNLSSEVKKLTIVR
jgi:hypothetical protein